MSTKAVNILELPVGENLNLCNLLFQKFYRRYYQADLITNKIKFISPTKLSQLIGDMNLGTIAKGELDSKETSIGVY
jgi:hypothetical protein